VLESTFYSLDEIAKRQYWFLPTRWLLNYHFENGRKLKQVSAPVIVIHSVEDDYIPILHGQRLFHAAATPKWLIETTGPHTDSFDHQWAAFGSGSKHPGEREAVLSKLMGILRLGVRNVAPSHCSGGEAMGIMADVFGDRYLNSGLGRVVTVNDLVLSQVTV
jgi:hypothetical protein